MSLFQFIYWLSTTGFVLGASWHMLVIGCLTDVITIEEACEVSVYVAPLIVLCVGAGIGLYFRMRAIEKANGLEERGMQPLIVRSMSSPSKRIYYLLVIYTLPMAALPMFGVIESKALAFSTMCILFAGVTALFARRGDEVKNQLEDDMGR